ncbi:anaphase-promoting complex subunit 11 [Pilobolus umbonatus]|nr:anaphase-promoting complex subunit 11 [Pilobolus umbonatus]
MKIHVRSWNLAAQWSWRVAGEDICSICQSAYESCCPSCTMPGDDCPVVWGECSHIFHLHCIETWCLNSKSGPTCPNDRKEWKTATAKD